MIEDVEGVKDFTHLGVPTSFKGAIGWTFGPQSERSIAKAKKYLGAIYRVGSENIDRREAVKTCWDGIAIQSILFGCETSIFTKKDYQNSRTNPVPSCKTCYRCTERCFRVWGEDRGWDA